MDCSSEKKDSLQSLEAKLEYISCLKRGVPRIKGAAFWLIYLGFDTIMIKAPNSYQNFKAISQYFVLKLLY